MPFVVVSPEHELPAPGICVLCESSRVGRDGEEFFVSEVGMIDAPGPFYGRKIVCERCAGELGHLVGMESGVDVESAREVSEEARSAVAEFSARVAELAGGLVEVAESVRLPEPAHERAARKRDEFDRAVSERVEEIRAELEAAFAARVEELAELAVSPAPEVAEEAPAEDAVEVSVEGPEVEAEADGAAEAPEAPAPEDAPAEE